MRRFALLCLALPLIAAAPPPRAGVDQVASAIADNYFDSARGSKIARDLRASAARGDFDKLADPDLLALALTERLRPLDGHFDVRWAAPAPAAAAAPPPPEDDGADRRAAYGFRRVEVLPGNVGLIDLRGFYGIDGPASPARRAADAALALVGDAGAVIVDVRDNGGGAPSMVGYLVSAFVAPGADVYNVFHERAGTVSEAPAVPYPAPRPAVPLFVLVSGRTGSAAEAFAYTLKAAGRATIVGEASAGAANPGDMFATPGGYRVFVPTGTPINPRTGGNWEGGGVVPDVKVAAGAAPGEARRRALTAIAAGDAGGAAAAEARRVLEATAAPPAGLPPLADFPGGYGEGRVAMADGALVWRRGRRPDASLAQFAPNRFAVVDEPLRRFDFERDAAGRVIAVTVDTGGGPRRFERSP